jgi:hypothetical protein
MFFVMTRASIHVPDLKGYVDLDANDFPDIDFNVLNLQFGIFKIVESVARRSLHVRRGDTRAHKKGMEKN